MTIDVNAYLGHFAFRRLRHNTAATLLALMDSKRIDKAVASSASAITYRNAQAGNEEVAEEVKGHRDRLIPFAVINPSYAGWQDDLKTCHEDFGMTGLRLYPKWHNYSLSDRCCLDLVNAATERGMIISIPLRAEDKRQRSWLVDVPDFIGNLGAERVIFGSGMPFSYPDPALLKMDALDVSAPDGQKIRWQNAARWLRL